MTRLVPLALFLPLGLTGCASQQTLDAQAAAARELEALKLRVAQLAADQADTGTRLGKLESGQALLASTLASQTAETSQAAREAESARAALDARLARIEAGASQADTQRALALLAADTVALATRLDQAETQLAGVRAQADDAVKIARDSRLVSGRLADELMLDESMVLYGYEQPELTASGRTALDGLIAQIKPRLPHVFIEIVGYTDNLSLDSQNRRIALERAESVRRYLHETGGIPLDRMSTISYGDLKPVASNATLEGRGQNRRVWVRVLK